MTMNCGGSSLKVALVDVESTHPPGEPAEAVAEAALRTIGGEARLEIEVPGRPPISSGADVVDHGEAARVVLEELARLGLLADAEVVAGVGHRVVHGGNDLVAPVRIDAAVLARIEESEGLAPLHNGPAALVIRAAHEVLGGDVAQVAVFDTAFHHELPARAANYAIPHELASRHGIRRFGFHGLAHRWMSERYAARRGVPLGATRLVTLQLGNGCSAAAIDGGRSVDTSMGLTPLEGLMMATRSGDVDPALVGYLARREQVSVEQVEEWLNRESGVLGVSGRSRSLGALLRPGAGTDARTELAIEMFCYRARKYVGSYVAVLGGADAVVFGGGVGEHQPEIRRRICDGLDALGVQLDDERNVQARGVEATISRDGSPVGVEVLPVDEATVIAVDTARTLLDTGSPDGGPSPGATAAR